MQFIYTSYLRALSNGKEAKMKVLESKVEELNNVVDINLEGPDYVNLLDLVDSTFKKEMISCFTTFTSISQPIVSDEVMVSLILEYKTKLPSHYQSLLRHLQFSTRVGQTRNDHLTDNNIMYYDCIVFNQFLIQARVANPKQLVHWACVVQASNYAQDLVSNKTLNLGSYFGFSCAYNTMIRFVNDWKGDILANIYMRCKQENRIKACLDNNQRNFLSKRWIM